MTHSSDLKKTTTNLPTLSSEEQSFALKATKYLPGLSFSKWFPTPEEQKELDEYFPLVHPQHGVYGDRIILQLRSPREKIGSLFLPTEVQDTQKWNEQIARVIAIGPTAFHFQKDLTAWPEGDWFSVGDYVRVPMYGSERWEIPYKVGQVAGAEEERKAVFVIRRAHEVIAPVFGNPLTVRIHI